MEITNLFKVYVKAVGKKRKDLQSATILPQSKVKNIDSFNNNALEVVVSINKLRDFLLKYQTDYLSDLSHFSSSEARLTDADRDQIDSDAEFFIKSCSNAISTIQSKFPSLPKESQNHLHRTAVVELLRSYLNEVCKLYSQQRAFRVKRAVDRKRLTRLSTTKSKKQISKETMEGKELPTDPQSLSPQTSSTTSNIATIPQNKEVEEHEYDFTPEEKLMFEEENERLFNEANSLSKEVRNIEGKVIAIGQLQEIFQEKVITQSAQIESIQDKAISTTEDVKDGNEQIRDAIKNSATFRVWILFFLMMCTFSLLFLDWYNY